MLDPGDHERLERTAHRRRDARAGWRATFEREPDRGERLAIVRHTAVIERSPGVDHDLGGARDRRPGRGHDDVVDGADGREVDLIGQAVPPEVADRPRVLAEVLQRRRRGREPGVGRRAECGGAGIGGRDLVRSRRERRALMRRRQGDDRADRRERRVGRVVDVLQELVDDHTAL